MAPVMDGERGPVDLDAVASWMDGVGLPSGPITGAATLTGGTQNILLRFDRGGRTYVLRRGPEHLRPKSNDAMRREMRVLGGVGRKRRARTRRSSPAAPTSPCWAARRST